MFTKVCGLTTKEQIDQAIFLGFDAIGIVTYAKSKRYCPFEKAVRLAQHAQNRIQRFVVGVEYGDVEAVAPYFDFTQIYEKRQVPNLVLASKDVPPSDLKYRYFVYDASIGSGVFQPFPNWVKDHADKIIVAGGLTHDNVGKVIQDIRPFGVDVSSGVEKNGTKDVTLMKAFIEQVKRYTR